MTASPGLAATSAPAPPPSCLLSSEALLRVAVDRVRTARPELADLLDLSSPQALRSARAGLQGAGPNQDEEVMAVVVIGRLDLPSWVRETCAFVLGLAPTQGADWRRAFTRTVYLAGSPHNLRERFAFDHAADDGSVAWAAPAAGSATATLRRLLKTFEAPHELTGRLPAVVSVPGRPRARPALHRELYIATVGVTVADALVHVNHLVAEAVLDGLIGPGDRLTLRFVPHLTGLGPRLAMLRVDTDVHRPDELRAYAGLTTEV